MSEEVTRKRARSSSRGCILCAVCGVGVAQSGFATLMDGRGKVATGCTHDLCIRCFGTAHGKRGANLSLCCLHHLCHYSTGSWSVTTFTGWRGAEEVTEHSIALPTDTNEGKPIHPNLFFHHQAPGYRSKKSILSFVTANSTDPTKTNCFAAELRHEVDTEEVSEDTRKNLQAIG